MSFATILAIDLGKFKSVLCLMDVATRTHRFLTVESTPELIRQAVQQHCSINPAQTQVAFETCDTCGWVDDPRRFKSGEELASYAGLVPKQMQSGEMNRLGHITHRGPGLLRSMLVEAAWTIYRHNPWAQAFVNKISHGSKARRKLAIVALAKKVLIILWGMLKSNQPFRSPLTVASMN